MSGLFWLQQAVAKSRVPRRALRVGIMVERAESIWARLELSSSDGGTCVRAVCHP